MFAKGRSPNANTSVCPALTVGIRPRHWRLGYRGVGDMAKGGAVEEFIDGPVSARFVNGATDEVSRVYAMLLVVYGGLCSLVLRVIRAHVAPMIHMDS